MYKTPVAFRSGTQKLSFPWMCTDSLAFGRIWPIKTIPSPAGQSYHFHSQLLPLIQNVPKDIRFFFWCVCESGCVLTSPLIVWYNTFYWDLRLILSERIQIANSEACKARQRHMTVTDVFVWCGVCMYVNECIVCGMSVWWFVCYVVMYVGCNLSNWHLFNSSNRKQWT